MHKSAVASMIALLKAKIGSSSFSRCSGIFLMSVSSPTQRNDFLRFMFSNNCCLSAYPSYCLLFFTILESLSTLNFQLSTYLKFAFLQPFRIFSYDQVVDTVLYIPVHESRKIINRVINAVVGDTSLRIVVCTDFRRAVSC